MKLIRAVTLSIGDLEKPVATPYDLGRILYGLYKHKSYRGEPIASLQKDRPDSADLSRITRELLDLGVIETPRQFPGSTYTLLGKQSESPEDAACSIDPFCYLSHLSAMSFHGLTDRIPSSLHFSRPASADWKVAAEHLMKAELGDDFPDYVEVGMPTLRKYTFDRLGQTRLQWFHSKHLGAFKKLANRQLRVSTIGRTFLDMLRNPELCGGMSHVLRVFDEHALRYLRLITDEVDRHGKGIDKVRAGYLLQERLRVNDNETINSWAEFVQRGGSRKLDPSAEYIPEWSDRWCISLNLPEATS